MKVDGKEVGVVSEGKIREWVDGRKGEKNGGRAMLF